MQKNLHPAWNHSAVITCSCGNTFVTGSTQDALEVDICSKCHPFFTGEMRFVDRQGRVDKFRQKMEAAKVKQAAAQARQAKKSPAGDDSHGPAQSYKQLLQQQKDALKKAQSTPAAA